VSLLSVAHLNDIVDRLLLARKQTLLTRSVKNIAACIDRVVARFLDPTSAAYQEAVTRLPDETGLSPEMIRHTLPLIFQEYRSAKLTELLDNELGTASILDRFEPTLHGERRAYGVPLITQVLAGNIPGVGLDGVIFALLVKSATLVKTASAAPFLPRQFARLLNEIDPELGQCLAIVSWPGGNTAVEEVAFSRADIVLASGSDESLAAIRQRMRGRFIGYGHKISFAIIDKNSLHDASTLAQRAAYDVALFDQQGCLSPQLIYVQDGGAATPPEFAALLAQGLAHWQQELPRGAIPPAASMAIRRLRDQTEWQALAGKDVTLYASPHGTEWTVLYEAEPTFAPSPLYRTVRVKPFSSFAQLAELLTPMRLFLEAAGVAIAAEQFLQAANVLGQAGVSRMCPIGTMQLPPLSWRHGGRPRIADLVWWAEIEMKKDECGVRNTE
jgi:hypothetical protein